MKTIYIILLVATISMFGLQSVSQTSIVTISGVQLKACVFALSCLNTNEVPNLDNYTILVKTLLKETEVIFVPNQPEGEPTVRGGKTKYGQEVHYIVALEDGKYKIIRKFFAR